MQLIDRRIGFIFAVFLALLAIGATKAAWLGVVQGRLAPARRRRSSRRRTSRSPPARLDRGRQRHRPRRLRAGDGHRRDAAPGHRRDEGRGPARADHRPRRDHDPALARPPRHAVRLPRPRHPGREGRAGARSSRSPGWSSSRATGASTRCDWTASQLLGSVGTDGNGLGGLEYTFEKQLARHRRRAPAGQGRDGRAARDPRHQAGRARQGRAPHARRQPPGPGRGGAGRGRREVEAQGRDRDRHGPAQRRAPRARELAARERQRARQGARRRRTTNRAVATNYEPGSTFKAFTVAAALEEGKVTPETSFSIPSVYTYADRELHDAEDLGMGSMTTSEILKYSSNIGAVKIAGTLGGTQAVRQVDPPLRLRQGDRRRPAGRGDRPGARRSRTTRARRMGNLPIGQGISVTPMQMMAAYAAIANGGVLRPPHIVDKVGGKPTKKPRRQAHPVRGDGRVGAQDARGRPRRGRHRVRRRTSPATRPRARRARPRRRSTASTPRSSTSRRSSASRPPSTRSCSPR